MGTATVSVLVSGAVGLGGLAVPLITTRMANARRVQDAIAARWDELRGVVDDAALALMAVREAEPQLEELQDGWDAVRAALPRLRAALMKVRQQEARLAARLGMDAEIVRRYATAHHALGELHTYWSALVDGETPPATFSEANAPIQPAISEFFSVAAEAIGPDRSLMPPSKRKPDTGSRRAGHAREREASS